MKSVILIIAVVLVGSLSGVAVVNAGENHNSSRSNTATSIHEKVLDDVHAMLLPALAQVKEVASRARQIHTDVSDIVDQISAKEKEKDPKPTPKRQAR